MSHRAGLAALDRRPVEGRRARLDPVIQAIEAQRPRAPAGRRPPLPRDDLRLDRGRGHPTRDRAHAGRDASSTPVVGPLGLRTWIGLPEEAIGRSPGWSRRSRTRTVRRAREAPALVGRRTAVIERSVTMGGAFAFPAEDGCVTFNDPALQAARDPGRERHRTARSLARLYAGVRLGRSTGRRCCPPRRPDRGSPVRPVARTAALGDAR